MKGYHLPISWAMNSTDVNDATYCRSHTPNAPAFSFLSVRTQAFTYIKVYKSCIHSPPSTQDLGHSLAHTVTFYVHNKCPFPIWPGTAANAGHPVIAGGGFYLPTGETRRIEAPWTWCGRIWARTGCNFNSNWQPACETGDCDGRLQCDGLIGTPPATLVQIALQGGKAKPNFYDVSLVDGYNLPVSISTRPFSPKCAIGGCSENLNNLCPQELEVRNKHGQPKSSQNWVNHGGDLYNRRYVENETVNGPETASDLRLKWEFIAGKHITATPAIFDGTLYFPSWNGNIYAIQACDGSLVWEKNLEELTGLNATGFIMNVNWTVSRATPIIADNLLIIGIYGPAIVIAVERLTGEPVWSIQLDNHAADVITMFGTYYKGSALRDWLFSLL
ncbi:hypothetical protein J1N35_040312 [Gossypium stocksii]|uniref:Uncharacterized protein n=1 Tax=Gossypium stocksii TaxID=47602 RepID=A0A9D3UDC2_9ROSI|nr:hypothetical protein J1N35_040312 [Gossypium stocksii]